MIAVRADCGAGRLRCGAGQGDMVGSGTSGERDEWGAGRPGAGL